MTHTSETLQQAFDYPDHLASAHAAVRVQQAAIEQVGDLLALALSGGRSSVYYRRVIIEALDVLRGVE
jgi:hypothetical protein